MIHLERQSTPSSSRKIMPYSFFRSSSSNDHDNAGFHGRPSRKFCAALLFSALQVQKALLVLLLVLNRPQASFGFSTPQQRGFTSTTQNNNHGNPIAPRTRERTSSSSVRRHEVCNSRLFGNLNDNRLGGGVDLPSSGASTPLPPSLASSSLHQQQQTPPQQQQQRRRQRFLALRPLFSSTAAAEKTYGTSSSTSTSTSSSTLILSTLKSTANWASLLCVLDCTILPLLTLLLPLLGWMNIGNGSVALQHTLHVWSHNLALFFVVPFGTTTTLWNYSTGHRNPRVAALGMVAVLIIGLANMGGDSLPLLVLPAFWQHGMGHRILSVLGCGLLLGSNYLSQQLGCDCGIPFCQPKSRNNNNSNINTRRFSLPTAAATASSSPLPPASAMAMQTRMIQYKYQNKSQQQQPQSQSQEPQSQDSSSTADQDQEQA